MQAAALVISGAIATSSGAAVETPRPPAEVARIGPTEPVVDPDRRPGAEPRACGGTPGRIDAEIGPDGVVVMNIPPSEELKAFGTVQGAYAPGDRRYNLATSYLQGARACGKGGFISIETKVGG